MEEEKKGLEIEKDDSSKRYEDIRALVDNIVAKIDDIRREILLIGESQELREVEIIKRSMAELQSEVSSMKRQYGIFVDKLEEILESDGFNTLGSLEEKLGLLKEKVFEFLKLFKKRKDLGEDFLKKIDYLIMNEAVKNEMAGHIFDMVNRGESKDKLMNAALEFVYFLKEIESDDTLKDLKEVKEFVITINKEEINITHFLDRLNEKLKDLSVLISEPKNKIKEFKDLATELMKDISVFIEKAGSVSSNLRDTEEK